MDYPDEIGVKIGGINNQTKSSGSTYGKFYVGTKEDFEKDPTKFAKDASDFLTKGAQGKINIGWLNKSKMTKSQGQKIKWALKDDYSPVIKDLINKTLGLKESVNEGGMDELDELAQDSIVLESFKKEALKDVGNPNSGMHVQRKNNSTIKKNTKI